MLLVRDIDTRCALWSQQLSKCFGQTIQIDFARIESASEFLMDTEMFLAALEIVLVGSLYWSRRALSHGRVLFDTHDEIRFYGQLAIW
jgi:hypothetical protein